MTGRANVRPPVDACAGTACVGSCLCARQPSVDDDLRHRRCMNAGEHHVKFVCMFALVLVCRRAWL
eukprot:scaffold65543_cov19-Tisochrysis_lutea.AAC.2